MRHALLRTLLPRPFARSMASAAAGVPAVTIDAARAGATRLAAPPAFILGSSSASRLALLEATGVSDLTVMAPDIDEKALGDRATAVPANLVRRIALAKADALVERLAGGESKGDDEMGEAEGGEAEGGEAPRGRGVVLLTGDQVVTYDGAIREKPVSEEEAHAFIASYSTGPCR